MSDEEGGSGRLSGIGDALDGGSTADAESHETTPETASTPSRDTDPEPETDVDAEPPGPAFPYEATKQTPVYPHDDTATAVDDLMLDVQRELRDYEIRDLPKRELHDAIFQVAIDNPRLVVDRILEARGIER